MKGRFSETKKLDYCKTILEKMTFNKKLFLKEYRKSLTWLESDTKDKLRQWVRQRS